jgi:putative DNA primase/helicase
MNALLEAALHYARLGWCVIPLRPRDKRPLLPDWQNKATCDPLTVKGWWRRWPDANVGIATGAGLLVLDVDATHDGFESLALLEDTYGALPDTPAVLTGSGGRHIYFRLPEGVTVRNSTGKLGPGLDVRGDGGYVVAPPSVHPNGTPYLWLEGQDPWTQVLADPPDWLLRLIAQPPTKSETGGNGTGRIPEGRRNVTLASIAGSLRRRGLDERAIGAALSVINSTTCDPPLPSAEVDTIARSIARYDPDPQTNPAVRDLGHAEVLAMLFENRLRWCADWGRWLRWDGTRWAEATHEEVAREAAEELRRHYADQMAATSDKARITDLTRCVLEACTFARVQGALSFLKGWPGVVTRAAELDADPWLLNVQNGTVDLRTGTLRPHDPADLITKRAEVTFNPAADTGAWQRHVEMVLPNPNVRREVQRSLGLALVGEHLEERLDIWHGSGANGKSTTISALLAILGDYAIRAAPDLLVQSKYDRHPTELADLQGRRLVFSVEVADGKRLAEALVKDLTGGDRLKARFMRQDFFEFKPTHSLFLACNAKPVITGQDMGIWRRIHLIPWEITIPPDQQRPQADVLGRSHCGWAGDPEVAARGTGGLAAGAQVDCAGGAGGDAAVSGGTRHFGPLPDRAVRDRPKVQGGGR